MIATLKKFVKNLAPPVLQRLGSKLFGKVYGFHGDYASWEEARAASFGYESDIIFEKACTAMRKVKAGEAAYERDTVLFHSAGYEWPLLGGLLRIASLRGNRLRVLDFGGALGSLYYQHRKFLKGLDLLEWYVVEQSHFVSGGQKEFQDRHLRFFANLETCIHNHPVDVALLVSALPYLKSPYAILGEIMSAGIPHIIIDRVPLLQGGNKDRLTVQRVSPRIYNASYPAWFFKRDTFLSFIQNGYHIHASYPCAVHADIASTFEGFILEKD